MSKGEYEIGATIPVQVGKGKMEKGKDNTEMTAEDPKTRNEKYGFIEIKANENKKSTKKETKGTER